MYMLGWDVWEWGVWACGCHKLTHPFELMMLLMMMMELRFLAANLRSIKLFSMFRPLFCCRLATLLHTFSCVCNVTLLHHLTFHRNITATARKKLMHYLHQHQHQPQLQLCHYRAHYFHGNFWSKRMSVCVSASDRLCQCSLQSIIRFYLVFV